MKVKVRLFNLNWVRDSAKPYVLASETEMDRNEVAHVYFLKYFQPMVEMDTYYMRIKDQSQETETFDFYQMAAANIKELDDSQSTLAFK